SRNAGPPQPASCSPPFKTSESKLGVATDLWVRHALSKDFPVFRATGPAPRYPIVALLLGQIGRDRRQECWRANGAIAGVAGKEQVPSFSRRDQVSGQGPGCAQSSCILRQAIEVPGFFGFNPLWRLGTFALSAR